MKKSLTAAVQKAVRRGGNALIPFDDDTGSVLEVMHVLGQWSREDKGAADVKVVAVGAVAREIDRFKRTFLEYSRHGRR